MGDNPLLSLLGRRGRQAVIRVLRSEPGPWNLRALAHAADVHPVAAARAVADLEAVGAAERYRPGRDVVVTWLPGSVAARFLAGLDPPDLQAQAGQVFVDAYDGPGRVILHAGGLAVVTRDEDAALDAAGPALDAVRAAGLPLPTLSTWHPDLLDEEARRALGAGQVLRSTSSRGS